MIHPTAPQFERRPIGAERLPWNRVDFAVAILIVTFCAAGLIFYQRIESYDSDSSYYIGLANSLLNQHQYVFDFKPHTRYPPGFPAILAVISIFFGATYGVYVRAMAVLGALGLWTSYVVLRRSEGRAAGATACVLLGSSPYFFQMTTRNVLSDVPFFLTTMLALSAAQKAEAAKSPRNSWFWGLAFLIFLGASLMIRSAGVALLGGSLIWLVIPFLTDSRFARARIRIFLPALVLGILAQVTWMTWAHRSEIRDWPGEYTNTYWNQVRLRDPHQPELGLAQPLEIAERAGGNLPAQSAYISQLVTRLPWVDPVAGSVLVIVPIFLMIAGCWISVRDHGGGGLETWYLTSYIGLYLFWPYDEGPRFIFPVFALIWLWFWRGGGWLAREFWSRWRWLTRRFLALAAIVLLGSSAGSALRHTTLGIQARVSMLVWGALLIVCVILLWTPLGDWLERLVKSGGMNLASFARVGALSIFGLLIVLGVSMQIQIGRENLSPDSAHFLHNSSVEASQWIASHSEPNDAIMAGEVAIVHRVTEHPIFTFPVTSDPELMLAALRTNQIKFLVVITGKGLYYYPSEEERFRLLSASEPATFSMAKQDSSFLILRVLPDGASERASRAE
jgi:hypothetical protein